MGIAVALLSVTGVVIWAKKRARRRRSAPVLPELRPDRLPGSRIAARTENVR
jgi:uncharacterized iron-regulated membrane protein